MKTKYLCWLPMLVMATASLSLSSCGDDDETGTTEQQTEAGTPTGQGSEGGIMATSPLVGKWSVRGIAVDEDYEYIYTGTMSIDDQSLALRFMEESTGNHAAYLKSPYTTIANTLLWSSPDPSEPQSESFTYLLSNDGNTLTLTFADGNGIDGWIIKTMTATRVDSSSEGTSGGHTASLTGTWYSAYLVTEGQTVYIEQGPNGPLDGFYHEFLFEDNGRATMFAWSGDDTWEGLPFAWKVEGNTVTADMAEYIDIDGQPDASLRHVFTYDQERNQLVWHTFFYDGDNAEKTVGMDVYFNKK